MRLKEGLPFLHNASKEFGVVLGYDEHDLHYYTVTDGLFVKRTLPKGSNIKIFPPILNDLSLSAKIMSIDTSSNIYGNRQRKEDLIGSALNVVDIVIPKDSNQDFGVVLMTTRRDGATVTMDYSDIIFIYPEFQVCYNSNMGITTGSEVIAHKIDVCSHLIKGEKYIVMDVEFGGNDGQLDILTVKKGEEETLYFSYRKNFKLNK